MRRPSTDAVARNGRTFSWAPSADAVAGRGNRRERPSGALQQLDTHIVWRLHKGNPDAGSNGTRGHGEDGATLGEFGICRIDVVDAQPEVIQTQVWLDRGRGDIGLGRHMRQEHGKPVDVQINAWPPIRLDGLDNLGIEHALIVLRCGHGVAGTQMDVVIAVYWHSVTPHWISGWVEMNLADFSGSTCGARTSTPAASSCNKKVTLLSLL